MQFKPLYPDVLGAVTGGVRISMNHLQVAVGIFPKQAYINQPVEVAVVLQSMVDQSMRVKVAVRVPAEDKQGRPVVIGIAKKMVAVGLRPGEVGVVRLPFVPHLPTKPGKDLPVRVAIRYRLPVEDDSEFIRPPDGGPPPSVIGVSPFRLQVLRQIAFDAHTWNESAEIITTYFNIAPKRIPHQPRDLEYSYETLWAPEQIEQERKQAYSHIGEAREIAKGLAHPSAYWNFLDTIGERCAKRGMPLHPGEAKAIAKMLSYTVDEAPQLEPDFKLENMRWFHTLCQVLAQDESRVNMDRGELITTYLYEAVIYDAVLLAFKVIAFRVKEDLGNKSEQINFASRILSWFSGHGQPDLNYLYLPLILGGVAVNRLVLLNREDNPWTMLSELREAQKGRIRLAPDEETIIVFEMLQALLEQAERELRQHRIDPP